MHMANSDPSTFPPQDHVLQLFRSVMPGVKGVVLSSSEGQPLAHDVEGDAHELARAGLALHRQHGPAHGASALVPSNDGLVLVVFLPDQMAAAWTPALAAA